MNVLLQVVYEHLTFYALSNCLESLKSFDIFLVEKSEGSEGSSGPSAALRDVTLRTGEKEYYQTGVKMEN